MLENFESDIEQWYYSDQTKSLKDFLCRDRALKSSDVSCLSEILVKGDTGKIKQEL
jgi:hypothetical protein